MVARVDARSGVKMGDTIKLALDKNRVHLFDNDTELRII